jgi:hypothetical protein
VTLLAILLFATAFRFERTVTVGAAGPNRLDVDVALLAGAQPGLRDVRLFDAQNREVGYLLVPPDKGQPEWIAGRVLPIASTKTTSGFEVDLGAAQLVDRLKLEGIRAPFLKRVTLEGSGDRAHWTMLADATVFDLPDEHLTRLDIAFPGGEYRYLRVTWDDRSSARVTGGVNASARRTPSAAPEGSLVDVAFAKRASEPGKSRYRINLPGAHLPITAMQVNVAGGNVFRAAAITEPRMGNGEVTPSQLGSGTLRQAQIGDAVASEMEVPVAAPIGRELDLVIDDGNNAPLEITRVVARLAPQPWIYFDSPDSAPLHVRYGNESATAPSYDIEAQREHVRGRKTAIARLSDAHGAEGVAQPAKMDIPLGAAVERTQFRVNRKIQEGPVGLSILPLDSDVLARSRDLDDVRIADAEGHQVPYLVEQRAEPLAVTLKIPERRAEGSTSIYRLDLPYERWPDRTRLVLTTTLRVFDRTVMLRNAASSHRNRDVSTLALSPWRSADPELLPPPLSFDLPSHTGALEVVIDEGDNAPLPLATAQLLLPSQALRFYNPGPSLFLLYGNRHVTAPRYDLALLAPRLFGEPARELGVAPAGAPDVDGDEEAPARKFFWIAIGIAAVVLIAMLARLLKT